MAKDVQEVIVCVLRKIKYLIDIHPQGIKGVRKIERRATFSSRPILLGHSSNDTYTERGVKLCIEDTVKECGINKYELDSILEKIKKEKIIDSFGFPSEYLNDWSAYYEIVPSKNFDELYKKIENGLKKNSSEKAIINGGKNNTVREIICVKPRSGNKFTIIINNDYANTIRGDKNKPSWDLLFKIASKELVDYESYRKNSLDYFNSNIKNRIYTQKGYEKTKILKVEGGQIVPNIKLSVISEKTFKTRVKKLQKG